MPKYDNFDGLSDKRKEVIRNMREALVYDFEKKYMEEFNSFELNSANGRMTEQQLEDWKKRLDYKKNEFIANRMGHESGILSSQFYTPPPDDKAFAVAAKRPIKEDKFKDRIFNKSFQEDNILGIALETQNRDKAIEILSSPASYGMSITQECLSLNDVMNIHKLGLSTLLEKANNPKINEWVEIARSYNYHDQFKQDLTLGQRLAEGGSGFIGSVLGGFARPFVGFVTDIQDNYKQYQKEQQQNPKGSGWRAAGRALMMVPKFIGRTLYAPAMGIVGGIVNIGRAALGGSFAQTKRIDNLTGGVVSTGISTFYAEALGPERGQEERFKARLENMKTAGVITNARLAAIKEKNSYDLDIYLQARQDSLMARDKNRLKHLIKTGVLTPEHLEAMMRIEIPKPTPTVASVPPVPTSPQSAAQAGVHAKAKAKVKPAKKNANIKPKVNKAAKKSAAAPAKAAAKAKDKKTAIESTKTTDANPSIPPAPPIAPERQPSFRAPTLPEKPAAALASTKTPASAAPKTTAATQQAPAAGDPTAIPRVAVQAKPVRRKPATTASETAAAQTHKPAEKTVAPAPVKPVIPSVSLPNRTEQPAVSLSKAPLPAAPSAPLASRTQPTSSVPSKPPLSSGVASKAAAPQHAAPAAPVAKAPNITITQNAVTQGAVAQSAVKAGGKENVAVANTTVANVAKENTATPIPSVPAPASAKNPEFEKTMETLFAKDSKFSKAITKLRALNPPPEIKKPLDDFMASKTEQNFAALKAKVEEISKRPLGTPSLIPLKNACSYMFIEMEELAVKPAAPRAGDRTGRRMP